MQPRPRPPTPFWCAAPPSNATCFTEAQLEHFFFNKGLTPLDVHRGRARLLGPPHFDDAEPENIGFLYTATLSVYGSCIVQSSLSPATRDRYQAWVNEWSQLCQRVAVPPLPVNPYALTLWVELLVGAYAGSSVNVALSAFFFFGKQFHYPLHEEKARIGPEAAAGPVSNSREEYPNRCWPTLRFHYGPRPGAIGTPSGHA